MHLKDDTHLNTTEIQYSILDGKDLFGFCNMYQHGLLEHEFFVRCEGYT